VPNPREILREFARVLRPGGIAGFSDAGRYHSRSEGAQLEMRAHGVLENDLILEDVWGWAQEAGFTRMVVKPALSPFTDMSLDDYLTIARGRRQLWRQPRRAWSVLKRHLDQLSLITERGDFMLHKGSAPPDSRISFAALGGRPDSVNARDLFHEMQADPTSHRVAPGEPLQVRVRVRNTGTVRWLHQNIAGFAVVKVGAHLYQGGSMLPDLEAFRAHLDRDVAPGQEATVALSFALDRPGHYEVRLDLVSELVAWFEQAGSRPARLDVTVG
jgi:hypothetical protein